MLDWNNVLPFTQLTFWYFTIFQQSYQKKILALFCSAYFLKLHNQMNNFYKKIKKYKIAKSVILNWLDYNTYIIFINFWCSTKCQRWENKESLECGRMHIWA